MPLSFILTINDFNHGNLLKNSLTEYIYNLLKLLPGSDASWVGFGFQGCLHNNNNDKSLYINKNVTDSQHLFKKRTILYFLLAEPWDSPSKDFSIKLITIKSL